MNEKQERLKALCLGRVASYAALGLVFNVLATEPGPHIEALIHPSPPIPTGTVMVTGSFTASGISSASGGWRIGGWPG
jgi:hypothetical protein